jgi:prepilin-type N-terminal cleavage/methylation domain-containing protein
MKKSRAFTLVELLVVIGIIAVLISILLPVLSSVRNSAKSVKCASALKELGNCMLLYAQENKGYLPAPVVDYPYNIGGITFDQGGPDVVGKSVGVSARWWNLLAKYISKAHPEGASQNINQQASVQHGTIIWGCPSYVPYMQASTSNNLMGDVNRNYAGYGMNRWPTITKTYPAATDSFQFPTPNSEYRFEGARSPQNGTWYKLIAYTNPAERALLGDGRWNYIEARNPGSSEAIPGQPLITYEGVYSPGKKMQTALDFYRHGKYPSVDPSDSNIYSTHGGKVAFNILFSDMHVSQLNTREDGYRALRMKFPG